jgi:hypothetical protein
VLERLPEPLEFILHADGSAGNNSSSTGIRISSLLGPARGGHLRGSLAGSGTRKGHFGGRIWAFFSPPGDLPGTPIFPLLFAD